MHLPRLLRARVPGWPWLAWPTHIDTFQQSVAYCRSMSFRAALPSLTKIVTLLCFVSRIWSETGWIDPRFDLAGADGPINSIEEFNGHLYIAGDFTQVAGVPANGLARWTGTGWDSVAIPGSWRTHAAAIS